MTALRSLPTKQYDTVWLRLAITRLAMTLSRLSRVSDAPSHKQVIRGAHRGRKRVGRGRYMAERNGSVHGQAELQTLCDTRMQVFPSFVCPRAANATRYRGRRRHSMRYNCLAQGQETRNILYFTSETCCNKLIDTVLKFRLTCGRGWNPFGTEQTVQVAAHGRCQGDLSSQNVVLFHGTCAQVFRFTPTSTGQSSYDDKNKTHRRSTVSCAHLFYQISSTSTSKCRKYGLVQQRVHGARF